MALILEEVINWVLSFYQLKPCYVQSWAFLVLNLECLVHGEYTPRHLFADSVQKATLQLFFHFYFFISMKGE